MTTGGNCLPIQGLSPINTGASRYNAGVPHVGDRIREYRAARGWTLEHLQDRSGVDTQTIHRIEIGQTKKPRGDTLRRIAKALSLSLEDLAPHPKEIEGRAEEIGNESAWNYPSVSYHLAELLKAAGNMPPADRSMLIDAIIAVFTALEKASHREDQSANDEDESQ